MPSYQLDITVQGHDKASGVFKGLEGSLRRIFEITGGILASRLILGLADQVGELVSKSIDATAQLQLMTVSLESLAGRELVRASDGMKTLADVEVEAGQMARKMIEEISNIAILSPYTVEAVQNTFRLNTAFGYTFKEAERMTEGLLKLASGVGADNEQLNRMAYNLAQVRLQGSVTKLDIRQLALAGIDLNDVLIKVSDQLGFQIENHKDFNKLIADGKITWEQFSIEFAKYADKYFGKSSEKMARTLLGLKSTFHDIFILTMPRIIGPSVERITKVLGKLLDMFIRIRDTDILERLGASWSRSIGRVLTPIETLLSYLGNYIDTWLLISGFANDDIGQMAIDSARLAFEKMKSPVDAIKDTILEIFGEKVGGLINFFIDKVAGGIDRIRKAWAEFAEGDIKGGFEALGTPKGLINFIDDILEAVGNLQEFWEDNGDEVLRIFGELFEGLIDFGGDQLNTGMEETGGFFERLTQRFVDNGPKIVEKLEEIKDTILDKVLPAISEFIDKLTNEWIPKIIEFGEYLRDNWQPILIKIVTILGTVVIALTAFKIFGFIFGLIMSIAGAFGTLLTAIAAAGGITAFIATITGTITAMAPLVLPVLAAIAAAFAITIAVIGGFIAAGILISKHWETIKDVLSGVWQVIQTSLAPAFADLVAALAPAREAFFELLQAFAPIRDMVWSVFGPIAKFLAGVFGVVIVSAIAVLIGVLTGALNFITGMMKTVTAVLQAMSMTVTGAIEIVKGVFDMIAGIIMGDNERIRVGSETLWLGLKNLIGGILGAILSFVIGIFGSILSFFAGWAQGFASVWAAVWTAVAERATGAMQGLATTIRDGWNRILEIAKGLGDAFKSAGQAIVEGIKEGIANGWDALVGWFQDKISNLINAGLDAAGVQSPAKPMIYMGDMMVAGLRKGLSKLPSVLDTNLVAPLLGLPRQLPTNAFDSHDTNNYAPVYQIFQVPQERFSAQGVG